MNVKFKASLNIPVTPAQLGATTQNWIGRSQYTVDPYLNGIVDDFRIYQQALTTDQILAIALQPNFILPFDETSGNNTADISGNNNNGTIINNGTFVPGVYNNAIKLDGVSSYVNLPAGILSNASDFTISSWVNLNNTGNWTRLFDFGFGTGKWMYFVPSTNTAVARFSIYNGKDQSTLSGTAPLPSNRWVHVAVTRQGTNGTLYINGQVVASWFVFISPNSLNASGLTAQNCIGRSQFSVDPYLNGIVDDFRFYYYALDQSQIAVLAQQLDIYLAFDESSGNTSADSSGNGNTASLIGNVTFVPGKTNNAIKLDGRSGYVNLSANILDGLADFTVATWVYLNSAQTWARVFDFGFGTSQYMHFVPKNNNGLAEFAIVLGATSQYMFGTTVPVNQWVHVAITRFGTLGTYYLNGQAVATSTITLSPLQLLTNTTNLTSQIWIGKSQFAADPYLNGIIDDFRVYRGALAADQVASLAQSLNLLYKFDETTNSTTTTADSSGNGDNASLIGNVTFVPGVNNNAISLSGNASYISLTNNQTIASLSDFTVSTWVYLNSIAQWARVFDFGFGTGRWMMLTVLGSKTIEYSIKDYGGSYTVAASQALPVGVWMHVAVTQQGNNVSIYLNGTLSGTGTVWKLPLQIYRSDVPAQNFIGHSQYSADPYLNGSIDDFRLYQGALSPAQIVALSQFLVLDLPFAESNGTVTADATGNGNIGQLIGGASFVAGRYPSDNPSNNAVRLDGSSGYINLPTGIVSQVSDFTISAFVYLNSAQTSARVFDFGSGTSNYMYFTPRGTNGVAQYNVLLNGTTYSLNASAAVPVGSWIHVAVTQRFNVVTLYINGQFTASLNIPATPAQLGATTQNWIGRSQYSADPYLNGIVDNFTIYYRTLAPSEIISLAQPFVFYYAFNQTSGTIVSDSSVNGYNGTLIGNATFVPGLSGNAVKLNGINSYVQINATNILQNVNDFTVATWVYLNSLVTWHRIFDFGFGTAQYVMFTPCGVNGCDAQFLIKQPNGTTYTVSAPSSLPTGQWVHVAVTLAGNWGTIYVNGTAFAWGTIPITPAQIYNSTLTAGNYIGHSQYSGDPYLNGTVDDFRFYQGALSAAQIAMLAA